MVDDFFDGVEVAVDEREVVVAVPHREFESVVVQVFDVREFAGVIGEFACLVGEEGTGCLEEFEQVEGTGGARAVDFAATFGQ